MKAEVKRYKTSDLLECYAKEDKISVTCELCGIQIVHKGRKIRPFFWYNVEFCESTYYCTRNCQG
jgi:hypothetical protein